ncbi:DUF2076 domain-containing protein [Marinomonas spartinae]|uniref:DUF2076 domain-containing protein n=1 Tax=Marinomonas spartinae TaxID=1792290 RepID=UPI0018F224B3|nr:DUF2076 domain-containing protein [Marinomonas spartinae]MBJ7555648.1 DUF2076 domain-containing protein [Marinomonas spartinae]
MSDDAKRLIDNLFERISQAEKQTGERDKDAEAHINKHLVNNPSAPYYMAQTIIMQEAGLKQLKAKVEALEKEVASKPSSGGFLSGLFGGGSQNTRNEQESRQGNSGAGWGGSAQQAGPGYGAGSAYGQQANYQGNGARGPAAGGMFGGGGGSSFLGGALKTAAGVAGGLVVGNMLMDMFSHHSPTEMVDIINETPPQDMGQSDFANNGMDQDGFADNGMDQGGFADNGMGQGGFGQAGFDQGGMDPDGFNSNLGGFDQGGFDQGGFGDAGGFDDFGGDFDDYS